MINTVKNVLGIESKVDTLHKTSAGILDIFSETIKSLEGLNREVEVHELKKFEEKKALEKELDRLAELKNNHLKVITKINKIFE